METNEKDRKLIPSLKSDKRNIYDKIRKNISKKKRERALEREELMKQLSPSKSTYSLRNNINDFVEKCRVGYYSMLDV